MNDAKEGVAKPLALVVSELLPLPLPLIEAKLCEAMPDVLFDASGDLVTNAEPVKLELADPTVVEVCDLSAVFEVDADADTDFETPVVAD